MSFKAHLSTGGKLRFIKLALQILGKIGVHLACGLCEHHQLVRASDGLDAQALSSS